MPRLLWLWGRYCATICVWQQKSNPRLRDANLDWTPPNLLAIGSGSRRSTPSGISADLA